MSPLITVSSGGPDIPEGAYPVVLADIQGPRTVTAQRGPKAGQDIDLFDWIFHVDAPGQPYDQTEISASTSTASGPRSKMFAFLTAIFGGITPPIGSSFEKEQLTGRHALATLQKDDEGWLRITNLGALPQGWNGQGTPPQAQPATATAPVQPAAQPASQPVAAAPAAREQVSDGSLPF
jgi:hypothetical protein